eukprot:scaffold162303_cov18-Tisochrysis_lutea.AAC.1
MRCSGFTLAFCRGVGLVEADKRRHELEILCLLGQLVSLHDDAGMLRCLAYSLAAVGESYAYACCLSIVGSSSQGTKSPSPR